jgi:hypothetical protein
MPKVRATRKRCGGQAGVEHFSKQGNMDEIHGVPDGTQLPAPQSLRRSTVIAVIVAIAIVFAIVLPAEYGRDPTGVGRLLGLKEMGEIKMALAAEVAADEAADALARQEAAEPAPAPASGDTATLATKTDSVFITLEPGQGREIKLVMRQGAAVTYAWSTDRGVVNYDTHGDPPNPPKGFYHGYGKGSAKPADSGTLVAAFDGVHGWFWRNRGREPLTVVLRVAGEYDEVREIK